MSKKEFIEAVESYRTFQHVRNGIYHVSSDEIDEELSIAVLNMSDLIYSKFKKGEKSLDDFSKFDDALECANCMEDYEFMYNDLRGGEDE